ncbi:MAG: hypothetical protein ACI9UA_003708 [Pseudoalteromonas tetraodonis]|jgi:hypothetical protein
MSATNFPPIWAALLIALPLPLLAVEDYEEPPISYSTIEPNDAVAQLRKQIAAGTFEFDRSGNEKTFLRSVLKTFNVPEATQVLVFSKTSKQNDHITPRRPRALYYSDEFYIGWVQGGDIEIISIDPELGPIFYLLEIPRTAKEKSLIVRDNDCLRCHAGMTRNRTPGLLIRSLFTDDRGFPILTAGTHFTEHTSPLKERWGGWYVTGKHGDMRHMGNEIATEKDDGSADLDREKGANLTSLSGLFDTDPYIRNDSDIVSLMVLEHQITAYNAIISSAYTARQAIHRNQVLANFLDHEPDEFTETTQSVLDHKAQDLLEALLFTDEFQLEGFGVEGSEAFQEAFAANAKKTTKGKSLKDLQLLSHLFKNRCSYMIYCSTFTNLPKPFKDIVFKNLRHILQAETPPEEFAHLSDGERKRIHSILLETLEGYRED